MKIELRAVKRGDRVQKLLGRGGVVGVGAPEDGVIVSVKHGHRVYVPFSEIDHVRSCGGMVTFEQIQNEEA